MRLRLFRPLYQRRARVLLATALLLPAAGFFRAAGINPITIAASAMLLVAAAFVTADALRVVAVIVPSGLLVRGSLGRPETAISWNEIVRVEEPDVGVVSISTRGKAMYQLQLDARAAGVMSRIVERRISSGTV